MKDKLTYIVIGILLLAVVLLVLIKSPLGAIDSTTITNPHTFQKAVTMQSTLALTGAASVGGLLTTNAGQLGSYTNSTSSSETTYTFVEADLLNYDTVLITLSGGAATFTLPATSTMTNMVPTAGDKQETCFLPITNTLTFAVGTGIDLQTASSSQTDLTIPAGAMGCLTYVRQADTDVSVGLVEYNDAD